MPLLKVKGYRTLDLRGNKIETLGTFDSKRSPSFITSLSGPLYSRYTTPTKPLFDPYPLLSYPECFVILGRYLLIYLYSVSG